MTETTTLDDEFWDDLFHGCAWAAFIEVAREQQGPPDEETTRRRAFALYEEALAERRRPHVVDSSSP